MSGEFNVGEGRKRRDAGIERVLENNRLWASDLRSFIEALPEGWTGMGEDIRRVWFKDGGSHPSHHNAWGGVVNGCVRRGVLAKTGGRKTMNASRSHARKTDVYIRTAIA